MKGTTDMADDNLALYVASYADADTANQDFQALKDAEGADLVILGAVVMSRDADGKVDVLEKGDGDVAAGAVLGGGAGLVVGLFAPPLLAATAVGAGIGAVLGHFSKKHQEKELGVDLDEYLPVNSSAVVVVLDNMYLDRVEKALGKSDKQISKAIDSGDYDKLKDALAKSEDSVGKAVDS
jgi:uncharacterized membrane protein